jgi:uncharacterized protein YggE
MKRRIVWGLLLLAGLIGGAGLPACPAQVLSNNSPAADGITVSGTGEVAARPNLVEVDLQVSGKAELTGDALVKYRDAKKRVFEALEKLKIENMTAAEHGLSITVGNSAEQQQRIMNGMVQNPGKPQVDVSSTVRVRLTGVREIPPEDLIKIVGRLVDVAQDAGINVGPNAAELMRAYRYGQQPQNSMPVRFVLTDLAELREQAYAKAVADARSRATRLAKLHQVKLGSALSIQEILVAGDQPASQALQINLYQPWQQQNANAALAESDGPRIVSSSLAGVPVQVRLSVRFAITAPDPATAQK